MDIQPCLSGSDILEFQTFNKIVNQNIKQAMENLYTDHISSRLYAEVQYAEDEIVVDMSMPLVLNRVLNSLTNYKSFDEFENAINQSRKGEITNTFLAQPEQPNSFYQNAHVQSTGISINALSVYNFV